MTGFSKLWARNCKLFFKDRGAFFSALITPVILLVLYATFLANVYRDSFVSAMPQGFDVSDALINGTVGAQLVSSLLAVSCVTVSFCSNLLMIQDKCTGAIRDITVSPVKRSTISLAYFCASAAVTLIVTVSAFAVSLVFLAVKGWYLSFLDVVLLTGDIVLMTLFGVALSSCINFPLSTNGQASAVGTIVSAGYGFVCGAYMPLASFPETLQKVLMFLPGTYGTSLIRCDFMRGVFEEMSSSGLPDEVVGMIRDSVDCNLYFFSHEVSAGAKYAVVAGSLVLFCGLYVLLNCAAKKEK